MINTTLLSTSVFTPNDLPASLRTQYGQRRYECFDPSDPNVPLDHQRKQELDHFDGDDHTRYIMVYCGTRQNPETLLSAVRLRPTLVDYELEMDSYRYLTHNVDLPKDPQVYEGNRWIGRSSRTLEGMLSTALLVTRLHRLARELGFGEIIGTISTLGEKWLSARQASTGRESTVYHSERDRLDILVSRIQVDQRFLEIANRLFLATLNEVSFDEMRISGAHYRQAA